MFGYIPDISGYYNCKGKEASGKGYTGVVILSRKGDVYMVQWVLQGGTSIVGVGIRQGASFSAAWALPKDGGITVRGVNVYRVEGTASGPRLVGRWASIPGDGQQQVEVLTFLKKLDPEE